LPGAPHRAMRTQDDTIALKSLAIVSNKIQRRHMQNAKQKTLINFKKAQSHIEKIIKMIQKDEYCIDIMQQNLAVVGLLRSAHQMLMENHLNTCFKTAMSSANRARQQKMTDEILKVTKLFNK
jgi:DNA-binding FrmR family transcriptional regulator